MNLTTVREIERAIDALPPQVLAELYLPCAADFRYHHAVHDNL